MIEIVIRNEMFDLAVANTKPACVGGRSNVRQADRMDKIWIDNFMGQLGNIAISLHQTGSLDMYIQARNRCNADPGSGDGGADLIGSNIDIKTSLMRRSQNINGYHLIVRDPEYHPGFIYCLGLVKNPEQYGMTWDARVASVTLAGWATAESLEGYVDGPFGGDYSALPQPKLIPMMLNRWNTVEYFWGNT